MTDAPDDLVKRLRDVSEWKQIIERHRRITDDPAISYVLKDGTRVHEEDNVIAKLAASLSRALVDAADVALDAASRIEALESRQRALREALEPFACRVGGFLGNITDADVERARAALAGDAP